MDEFTNLAIWLLIIFLAINSSIIWFSNTDTFQDYNLGIKGLNPDNTFTNLDPLVISLLGINIDCSTASSTELSYIPCQLADVGNFFTSIKDSIWNLFTAWSNLFGQILPDPLGSLIQEILGPLVGGIAFIGAFVILLRVAGIIRGGS